MLWRPRRSHETKIYLDLDLDPRYGFVLGATHFFARFPGRTNVRHIFGQFGESLKVIGTIMATTRRPRRDKKTDSCSVYARLMIEAS